MHPLDYNLELASLMITEMKDYLLSKEVFWPLSRRVRAQIPNLTIGNLLLTLDELQAQRQDMSPKQASSHTQLELQMHKVQSKWPVAMEMKSVREMHNRLNLWRAFITDIENRSDTGENYRYEVRQRVIFARLREVNQKVPEVDSYLEEMSQLDKRLQGFFVRDEFIWDAKLQGRYPRSHYWYLYGYIQPPE
jgi:hypothetical protein